MTNRISDPILEERIGSIAHRLEGLLLRDGNSLRQFALKINVSEGALRKILGGSTPNVLTAAKIANACGVTLDWFIAGIEDEEENKKIEKAIEQLEELTNTPEFQADQDLLKQELNDAVKRIKADKKPGVSFDEEFVLVPGYHIQVSAGNGCEAFDEEPKRWLAFRRKYLKFKGLTPNRCAVVFVKGDSMADTITDNDSLLIDRDSTKPIDGHIYVVRLGDELYAKRIQKSFDGSLILISDNKDYSPITVPKEQLDQLCVVGKVVQRATDL
ncbi:LexA family transcriptional regulator [Vibrio europaeus]|uniref:XRE family transcriptional regulator n=1 Tax=Vibrio europaeus TaxID=300876 RepID=UPI00233EF177|nr:XRE family transcriptional regulator [Vibrio europaeus]MDC5753825.1 LexA family transcriptional regulator [Vibrio europaeus]MDC5776737.1 LexA family transcriptional regulator [Vibrio europaeus]MDC5796753.1 LexA family transcriptional regulator [Vibrio europaeus]MDC5801750.1 LexA family transcriptional regulator [Vibrio europaeus]MDC5815723.1 LexA family transcriptional regulator [Vibrio europaeus]